MRVPFNDLTVPTEQVREEFLHEVNNLFDQKQFILGKSVEEFENNWSEKIGTKFCLGVSNGADALYLSLVACGIKPGDEVITQGTAYNASVTAILRAGAQPRFADIDPETLTIGIKNVDKLINKNTKAILPVHLYGQPGKLSQLKTLAQNKNLSIIEDCAQAHLAEFEGKKAGSWGTVGAFSFYPTKNLGAFGDAGAITTNDERIYHEILARRNLGQIGKNDHKFLGYNMRLDPIQALVLNLKLKYLKQNTRIRQNAADYYIQLIHKTGLPFKPQALVKGATHVYHLFVVESLKNNRDELIKKLEVAGIDAAVHYPTPVYNQPFYQDPKDLCPVTDLVSSRIFSLPLFVGITKIQQEYMVRSLTNILK